jgi:pyruvate formate lyase activating enzyme
MESGLVFNIQRYSLHDGPGIRTTVFLKGCPLCCQWCHNPEGMAHRPEIVIVESRCIVCGECRSACPLASALEGQGPLSPRNADCTQCGACIDACPTGARQMIGRTATVDEVMGEIVRDRVFYEESGGGVTFSGGEPLSQPRFLVGLLEACRAAGIHAVLDTTGFAQRDALLAAARLARLVLYDLKAFDEAVHLRLTGVSNRLILDNLKSLDREHPDVWIRLPVVPGFNDDLADLRKIAEFVSTLRSVTLVNLLPFHRTGVHKFERLGLTHALDGVETPSPELMLAAVDLFHNFGLKTRVGG